MNHESYACYLMFLLEAQIKDNHPNIVTFAICTVIFYESDHNSNGIYNDDQNNYAAKFHNSCLVWPSC